jgi:hypothetical protein
MNGKLIRSISVLVCTSVLQNPSVMEQRCIFQTYLPQGKPETEVSIFASHKLT